MSFRDCITKAVMEKLLKQGKADEAFALFDDLVRELREQGMSEQAAKDAAAKSATDLVGEDLARQKKLLVLGISAKQRIDAELRAWKNPKGENNYAEAALAFIERDEYGSARNFYGRKDLIISQAHSRMTDLLVKYEPKVAGTVRPKAGLDNIVREVFGEDTGDAAARELAASWSETAEYLRQRANTAGANIGKRDNWHFPNSHDQMKLARAGKKAWVEYVSGKLDWKAMTHPKTGRSMAGLPMEQKQSILGDVYDTIKTDGYVKLGEDSSGVGGKMLANRLGEQRFLQFDSASSWLEYQGKFGEGSPFDSMVNHIDHMSQQIAMLETFGPNPELMRRHIKSAALRDAALKDAASPEPAKKLHSADIEKGLRKFDELWSMATNQNALLKNSYVGMTLAGTRNVLTSAFLGSASLLAIPGDFLAVGVTKQFAKIEGGTFIKNYLKLMNPFDKKDRKLAIRLGLIADSATSIAYGQQRLLGQITGPQWTRRLSDITMRASLMTPHTQAARWAFGMEFLGYMADISGKAFDELDAGLQKTYRRHGITPDEWEAFRKTPHYEERGATFLRPDDMLARQDMPKAKAQAIADKFMEMVHGEMRVAVQESTLRGRAFLVGDSKPATFAGEIARSAAMFKNFPVSLMFIHSRRALMMGSLQGAIGYAAAMGIGLTLTGALSTQLRQITQGKDPITMNPATPEGRLFWGNAALTGGGLGIWGDFLLRDVNRYGGSPLETAAGPVAQFLGDTTRLTTGNLLEVAKGKDTGFASELLRYVNRYTPGGSIWYLRLALQRQVFDQLQEMADPKAHAKWRRQQTQVRKDYNQKFWWKSGTTSPQRAPNLGEAVQ